MVGIRKKNQVDTSDVRLLQTKERPRYDITAALAKAALVFLLVYGSIGGFLSAYEIAYNKGLCMFGIFCLAFLLSAVYETQRKWAVNLANILVFLLYVYVAFSSFWVINSGYYAIINHVLEDAGSYLGIAGRTEYSLVVENEYMAVTGFVLFLGMVGTILLQIRLHHKASLWTVILLTLPLYAVPFYFERSPHVVDMLLLFTGYTAVAALQGGNVRPRKARQTRDVLLPAVLAVVLIVQIITVVLPQASYTSIVRASAGKKASEGQMVNIIQFGLPALFGRGQNGAGVSGGMLSKGTAVMPDYETDLIVRYTPYSYDPVYLKAFTGKDYMGDRWTRADDRDAWMEQTVAGRAAGQSCGVMEVVNVGAAGTYDYRPYYTDHARRGGMDAEYIYFPPVAALQDVTEEVNGDYLTVPESCRRAVERICGQAGFSGTPREIAAQVTTYFDEHYSYTLRPGFYYGSPDYITHFLLESKRGYCAHFASAAVMLFRNMGIPARYAEGYAFTYDNVILDGTLVEGADYADYYSGYSPIGETALVELEIADSSAHAWVEIYIEGEGWIVVDPTPASGGDDERVSFWDDFLSRDGDAGNADFGQSNVGAYIETALGGLAYVLLVSAAALFVFFTGKYTYRRVKERRLPARERARNEYRRLTAYLSRRDREFAALRTIKEQTDWMNAHRRRGFTDEQRAALYELFFAGELPPEEDVRWDALMKHCRRERSFGSFRNR